MKAIKCDSCGEFAVNDGIFTLVLRPEGKIYALLNHPSVHEVNAYRYFELCADCAVGVPLKVLLENLPTPDIRVEIEGDDSVSV